MSQSMNSPVRRWLRRLPLAAALLHAPCALAQQEPQAGAPAPAPAAKAWDVYLSGYAYHIRSSYKDIDMVNEKAWGGGLGTTRRNDHGNDASWYAMVMQDSSKRPQWTAGYSHQWVYPVLHGRMELAVGLTAFMTRREDWFHGKPFPGALPMASIGTRRAKLLVTYVPHLASRHGRGNVLVFMGKISF